MSAPIVVSLALTAITAATPLLLASLGELVSERAGVINLGLEGLMLCGAIAAFATMIATGSPTLAIVAGALAGAALASLFAFVVLVLAADQVAAGLALTIFGTGLSALLGTSYTGRPVPPLPSLPIPLLAHIPVLGPLLFDHDILVYGSLALTGAVAYVLRRTRLGLIVRAVGEAHDSAHALGHNVRLVRAGAILFGGAMSGLAGAYLSLAYTPLWVENMAAGRGWIALAIVVFSSWRPGRLLLGAYIFGGIAVLQLYLQGSGLLPVPSQFFSMAPYLGTILVLVVISVGRTGGGKARGGAAPACLGKNFLPVR